MNVGAQMSSFINIQSGVETNLQRAIAYVGPVSVAVDASNKAFRVGNQRNTHTPSTAAHVSTLVAYIYRQQCGLIAGIIGAHSYNQTIIY